MKRKLLFSGANELQSNGIRVRFKRVGESIVDFINDLDGMIDSGRVFGER
jgi:hypothetical protein